MASLYKTANSRQRFILKVVEGAVKNVADHHGLKFDPRQARSIAKRAAGTLTAQWPDVLAIPLSATEESSDKPSGEICKSTDGSSAKTLAIGRRQAGKNVSLPARKRGASQLREAHPLLSKTIKALSAELGRCRKSKDFEDFLRIRGLIEALRIIDRVQKNK